MKMFRHIALPLSAAILAAGFTSCDDDDNYDNPSGETFIYDIAVSNGGFSGADNIVGEVDEETKTLTFTIPAETDIQALRFNTKLSLGASLDKPSYDISDGKIDIAKGTTDITVVNNMNSSVYHAVFNVLPATETPVAASITCRDDQGELCTGFVSAANQTVYLNCENSATAEIVSVGLIPRRTPYEFTELHNGKLSADNPGQLKLDFIGHTAVYDISFAGVPTFGADFSEAIVYDYSAAANIWSDFAAENTRWAQFDGENLFILSREGGTNPSIIKWDDAKAGSPVSRPLDKTGLGGGTFDVSAGGIAHGHFYACNLSTGLAETAPLKVYHWADENATCETVLEFPGSEEVKGRWGDNMSVTLDEAGNGYLWFFDHAQGASAARFRVENFNTVTAEPEIVKTPYGVAYYAALNPVIGEEGLYTLTSGYQQTILLVDIDLQLLNRIEPKEGCEYPLKGDEDARVINYCGERYMLATNYYGWGSERTQTLHLFDISSGMDTKMAFTDFSAGDHPLTWSYDLKGGKCSAYSANTGAAIGPDGELRLMAAAPRAGFIRVEVPKKK